MRKTSETVAYMHPVKHARKRERTPWQKSKHALNSDAIYLTVEKLKAG